MRSKLASGHLCWIHVACAMARGLSIFFVHHPTSKVCFAFVRASRSAHTLAPLKAQKGRSGAILPAARAGTFQRTRPASQPQPIRSGALHTQPHATIMSCLRRCGTSAPTSSKRQAELKASISSRSFHDVLAQGTKSVCDARPLRFFYFRGVRSTAIWQAVLQRAQRDRWKRSGLCRTVGAIAARHSKPRLTADDRTASTGASFSGSRWHCVVGCASGQPNPWQRTV